MRINKPNGSIGELDPLPGCSQIVVMHSSFVPPDKRNEGLGTDGHKRRLNIVHSMLYDMALCTVDLDNKPELRILKKCGWKFLTSFKSRKTGHKVGLFARGLQQEIQQGIGFPFHEDSLSEEYKDIDSSYLNGGK